NRLYKHSQKIRPGQVHLRPPFELRDMKKSRASEKGLIYPRMFAALLLGLAAISMAVLSFASTPSSGTLTDTSGPLTYTAGPFFQPNTFGSSIAGECDPDPSD